MRVWPKNEEMKRMLRHANGTGFREDGTADWPDDSFTARRVRDGDILLKEPVKAKSEPKTETKPL